MPFKVGVALIASLGPFLALWRFHREHGFSTAVCGWISARRRVWGSTSETTTPQEAAVAAITKLHGIIERDNASPGQPVIGVVFNQDYNRHLKASDLDCLKSLTDLRRFKLEWTEFGDAALERVAGLTHLRVLDMRRNGITDVGLRHLQKLSRLEELNLWANHEITDKGIANLNATPHLRRLDLGSTQVGDGSTEIIGHLAKLEELSLENCSDGAHLTDAGLKNLQGLSHLKTLDLLFTNITDKGMKYLGGMRGLKRLYLKGTKITDAGLEHIKGLSELEELVINDTAIYRYGPRETWRAITSQHPCHWRNQNNWQWFGVPTFTASSSRPFA